ncbi:dTDP-4-dehydrorhamnose reductase [Limibacter armeniacum]|uniref:dTDP-4-dehydrorhamnose reductase n=1 Tax=Limibacter armeniacum TaxID=466084 RepID=UPI002FE6C387
MKKILVTGADGQLGSELKLLAADLPFHFDFTDHTHLDITNAQEVSAYFQKSHYNYCINCAAYTAVDKAESEQDTATKVNVTGASLLAQSCHESGTVLIHISTDFVFDGKNHKPYQETDIAAPISVYGVTKWQGEEAVRNVSDKSFILRTSWLYSTFGGNFVKTMLRLAETRNELSIIADQIGTPTYAADLAKAIMQIIESGATEYGTYHFSNEGVASWYDFAQAIFELKQLPVKVNAIPTEQYPTPARRPHYSVMDKSKIKQLGVETPYWRDSLKACLDKLES